MAEQTRSRWPLLVLALVFLLPFITAVVLRFGGWQPEQTRNLGELLQPPLPMTAAAVSASDGSAIDFVNLDHRWALLVLPASQCTGCDQAYQLLRNVRASLGRHQDRLDLYLLGDGDGVEGFQRLRIAASAPPELTRAPEQGVAAWLVDPHGFLALRYPGGFDARHLRRDLSRLIK